MLNLNGVMRAFDALVLVREAARRLKGDPPSAPREPGTEAGRQGTDESALAAATANAGLRANDALAATLTNVVVAALKEAFDRDHARLELERLQIEEQRRRAEEALKAEQRRQVVERELGHLRLLAAMSLLGWIAAIAIFALRGDVSLVARLFTAGSWLLLLAALGTAFAAQRHVDGDTPSARGGMVPLWLLIVGLALAALSLLF
jgi:hypothetical protein